MSDNVTTDQTQGKPIPPDAAIKNRGRYGKYWDKTANVKARRKAYGWFILIALGLIAVALLDILVLELEQDVSDMLKLAIAGVLLVLIIIAVMMYITRTNEYARLEDGSRSELEVAILQCPECSHIFEFKENHFQGAKRVAFTCPSCGLYGAMPDMGQRPVKKVLPEGDVREYAYRCSHCNEEIRIGIFGNEDARQSRFRACPHCGEKGTVEMVARAPPPKPEEDEEEPVKGKGKGAAKAGRK